MERQIVGGAIREKATITRYANLAGTQVVATSTYGYNSDGAITSLAHTKGATNLNTCRSAFRG